MIKAIIFDADNTLYKVRNKEAYKKMFSALQKETGARAGILEREWKKIVENIMQTDILRKAELRKREYSLGLLLEKSGIKDKSRIKKITEAVLSLFWKQIIEDLEYDDCTKKAVASLKKKYALAIASDEFRVPLEKKLNHVFGNWKKYFEFVVSAEDAGNLKPSRRYLTIALKQLKAKPEEVLVIGDSWERDLELPKKLGAKTVLISEEKNGEPDYFVGRLVELLRLKF